MVTPSLQQARAPTRPAKYRRAVFVVCLGCGCIGGPHANENSIAAQAALAIQKKIDGNGRLSEDYSLVDWIDEQRINNTNRVKQIEAKVADLSTSIGDKFSERMAIAGAVLMGLSYPAGKLIWLLTGGACNHVASRIRRPFIRERLK